MGSGQTQVLAAVFMVALTALIAAAFYGAITLSQPDDPFDPDSPFDEGYATAGHQKSILPYISMSGGRMFG